MYRHVENAVSSFEFDLKLFEIYLKWRIYKSSD